MSTEETSVLDEVLGSTEGSSSEGYDNSEASDESGSVGGIDPKAFNDLVSAVGGLQSQFGKWGNEIGEIRNAMSSATPLSNSENTDVSGESSETWSKLMDNPDAYMEEKFRNLQQKQVSQNQQQINETRSALSNIAPDFDKYSDDVVSILSKDTSADKSQVQANLHNFGAPVLFNAYKRAQAEKENKDLRSLVDVLKNQGVDFTEAKRALTKSRTQNNYKCKKEQR